MTATQVAGGVSASRDIAAYQFGHRRSWLSRQVADRKLDRADAEQRLRPWLHIAALAGAQIEAVYEDHIQIFPYDRAGQPVQVPLVLSLSRADRAAALRTLAEARDAAFAAVETCPPDQRDRKLTMARQLALLAHDLEAPPYPLSNEQKEAA